MISVDLRSLVSKFNPTCRQALEQAVGYTLSRGQFNVEIEHLLLKLLDMPNTDVAALIRHFEIDEGKLREDLTRTVDRFKSGNTRTPGLSPNLITLGREAWLIGSLQFGARSVRSGHLLAAIFADDTIAPMMREVSKQFGHVTADALRGALPGITAKTAEAEGPAPTEGGAGAPVQGMPGAAQGGALDRFTTDLTAEARAGRIDPVVGRDGEVRQIIDILTRRRQNNPILTGEAGVGKTAVVEGFALRVANGDVPEILRNAEIRVLDLGLLQAGASAKGEFEERLKSVIDEVKAAPKFMITFIDEAHTLIGAGGAAGQNDAANLLKPALARGELRTIAATTWAEYKKYFERDAALARRFQVVKVDEPDEPKAINMIRGVASKLESHHKTRVLDEAVVEAVRLSSRYIQGRQLPDKAVSVLDTACARVAMSQGATPATVEDLRRRADLLDVEIASLTRETAAGGGHEERLAKLQAERDGIAAELETLEARWEQERARIDRIRELRAALEGASEPVPEAVGAQAVAPAPLPEPEAARAELAALTEELHALQGEAPLVHPYVDGQAVAGVVSAWTGVPLGRIVSSEMETIRTLGERLGERVIGQQHALDAIAEAIRASRAGLTDPRKPIGVFLMCGTSGVGKTETAMALADLLYGGEQNITVINMSEFKEEHKVSMLMGSPPGYVGYGEGGVLTEAVRRRPYGVVLLDEMEKAHPGVQDVFYQVFDKGMLKDGEGRDIDFKNTLIIMTSNAGTRTIEKLSADPETMPDPAGMAEALRPELLEYFKPAFIGRTTLVPYMPLAPETLRLITGLQLNRLGKRIAASYGAAFGYDEALAQSITERCTRAETGARNVLSIIEQTVMPRLAGALLEALAEGRRVSSVQLGIDDAGEVTYAIT